MSAGLGTRCVFEKTLQREGERSERLEDEVVLGFEVVDYHTTAPDHLPKFDVILDAVGSQLPTYRRRLVRGGRMVTIAAEPLARGLVSIVLSVVHGSRRIRFSQHNPTAEDFMELAAAVTKGEIRPTIGARYPLSQIRSAYEHSLRGGVAGKALVDVAHAARSE